MIGVCGFGRCGSTMVMEMLNAGGIAPVDGSQDRSHELDVDVQDWLAHAPAQPADRAVKILDAALRWPELVHARTDFDLFVWLDRDPTEQARSMLKLLRYVGVPGLASVHALAEGFARDRDRTLDLLRAHPRAEVMELSYEQVLADPHDAAVSLGLAVARSSGELLGDEWAAHAVHLRTSECKPGLLFELTGVAA